KFHFGITNGMSAKYDTAGRPHSFRAALDNSAKNLHVQLGIREANEIEGRLGYTAHREDITERIGGGDLSVNERVVNDGWEEINGLNDRQVRRKTVHPGIVMRLRADE